MRKALWNVRRAFYSPVIALLHNLVVQITMTDEGMKMISERIGIQEGIIGIRGDLAVDKFAAIVKLDVEVIGFQIVAGCFDQVRIQLLVLGLFFGLCLSGKHLAKK